MSGHSKWSTIKHKKAKEDAKKGKVFTKLIREITVAAREGGADPNGNAKLRLIIDKAKAVNMPQDNMTRAIQKGSGDLKGACYEACTYEGYGPHGVALMVETLSDNKNRTVSDLRHNFSKMGGSLAESGSVSWMFEHKGVIRFSPNGLNEDAIIEKMLEYPVQDLSIHDNICSVTCDSRDLDKVKKGVESQGFKVESVAIEWIAKNFVEVDNNEHEEKILKLLEMLEDMDDVQNVYVNMA